MRHPIGEKFRVVYRCAWPLCRCACRKVCGIEQSEEQRAASGLVESETG